MSENITDFLPTEVNHFKARYNPVVAIAMLIIGLLNLLIVLWSMAVSGGFNSGIITGIVVTGVGIAYLTRPYFSVAPNRLTIYNLLGSSVKRYSFVSFSSLTLKGNKLYIRSNEQNAEQNEVKANVAKWLTHPQDWKKLQEIANSPS